MPSDEWIEAPPGEEGRVAELAHKGLPLSEEPDEVLLELRRRDEALSSGSGTSTLCSTTS